MVDVQRWGGVGVAKAETKRQSLQTTITPETIHHLPFNKKESFYLGILIRNFPKC
jgi:hypothetical protein